MKKSYLVVAIAVAISSVLSSCKKDYTCTCTDTATNPATTGVYVFYNLTQSQAATGCALYQQSATTKCKL